MQLWDWDVLGKEKVGEGQMGPINEMPAGRAQDLWVDMELEAHKVGEAPRVHVYQ